MTNFKSTAPSHEIPIGSLTSLGSPDKQMSKNVNHMVVGLWSILNVSQIYRKKKQQKPELVSSPITVGKSTF